MVPKFYGHTFKASSTPTNVPNITKVANFRRTHPIYSFDMYKYGKFGFIIGKYELFLDMSKSTLTQSYEVSLSPSLKKQERTRKTSHKITKYTLENHNGIPNRTSTNRSAIL